MLKLRYYPPEEFTSLETARRENKIDLVAQFGYGAAWLCPWYHDPTDPNQLAIIDNKLQQAILAPVGRGFLSEHYWRDWARIRPPLTIILPNGGIWMPDQISSNNRGWQVTGELPTITVHPSINHPGYHGWLKDGEFSDDVDGRGPFGLRKT